MALIQTLVLLDCACCGNLSSLSPQLQLNQEFIRQVFEGVDRSESRRLHLPSRTGILPRKIRKELSREFLLMAFDMDDSLTRGGQPLSSLGAELLNEARCLSSLEAIAVVTAGPVRKVRPRVKSNLISKKTLDMFYIIAQNGGIARIVYSREKQEKEWTRQLFEEGSIYDEENEELLLPVIDLPEALGENGFKKFSYMINQIEEEFNLVTSKRRVARNRETMIAFVEPDAQGREKIKERVLHLLDENGLSELKDEDGNPLLKVAVSSIAVCVNLMDKRQGIRRLAKEIARKVNMTVKEVLRQTLVVGDSEIDVPMLNEVARAGGTALWVGYKPDDLLGLDKNVLIIEDYYGEEGTLAALEAHVDWLKKEVVHKAVDEIMAKKPPDSMATEEFQPGYLLIKDALPTGGDSKDGKIQQALAHLELAAPDEAKQRLVRSLLAILESYSKAEELTLLQFEGVANQLVKKYSENPNAYEAYKKHLDDSFLTIYPDLRNEIFRIQGKKNRLYQALMYAGIANLIDPSHPEVLKRIADDLGVSINLFRSEISKTDLMKLVKGIHEKIEKEKLLIGKEDFEKIYARIQESDDGSILYFLDNHGEIIIDQIAIEVLLDMGFTVKVVARSETVRDDVTADEARAILESNPNLQNYIKNKKLHFMTDGSYLMGADLTQSSKYPEFVKAWQEAIFYIAKGAGNFHTLFGQKLSIPGFHIRMMKESDNAYEKANKERRETIEMKSFYDMAFLYWNEDSQLQKQIQDIQEKELDEVKAFTTFEDRFEYLTDIKLVEEAI